MMTRRSLVWSAAGVCLPQPDAIERSFWVMKLLFPRSLVIRPMGTARLHCADRRESWQVEGGNFLALSKDSDRHDISGPGNAPVEFLLEVPGVIRRTYRGILRVTGDGEVLRPVITMDCETATGSIVGAELAVSNTAYAALAAQAVASRSFLRSREGRHRHGAFDCCDTTHCQFLRSPAPAGSAVDRAVCETSGIVLRQCGHTALSLYSGACGGRTNGGVMDGVRYSPVACEPCRTAARTRQGHGWGLCQYGAARLARDGWDWPAILLKYYPDFVIRTDSATV